MSCKNTQENSERVSMFLKVIHIRVQYFPSTSVLTPPHFNHKPLSTLQSNWRGKALECCLLTCLQANTIIITTKCLTKQMSDEQWVRHKRTALIERYPISSCFYSSVVFRGCLWLMTHHWSASTSHGEIQICRPSLNAIRCLCVNTSGVCSICLIGSLSLCSAVCSKSLTCNVHSGPGARKNHS